MGARVVDLSCAYAGRDEWTSRPWSHAPDAIIPIMIDTTHLNVHRKCVEAIWRQGHQIHLESGEERSSRVADGPPVRRRAGCLTINETGMAMNAERKVDIAKRLTAFCEKHGLRRGDLFIDALTFTIGSGDDHLRSSALETLEAIRQIKSENSQRTDPARAVEYFFRAQADWAQNP